MTEKCFNTCINTFENYSFTNEEISCYDRCVSKFIQVNKKVEQINNKMV